ncbi:TPA: C_GCAxxG_C_C family protein [Candidatus Poribacteria bacterium]|nr:C_GCAxxG_C_C family protein [Candidatus Poribacteria bacterium]
MTRSEKAVSIFNEGFSCSQATLSAFASDFGLDKELALKISCAFGGGISHLGSVCGAVSGALMVIGLKYGRTKKEDTKARDETYRLANDFINKFKERNNSTICNELLDCDISTTDGLEIARGKRGNPDFCPKFVKDAVEILEEIL